MDPVITSHNIYYHALSYTYVALWSLKVSGLGVKKYFLHDPEVVFLNTTRSNSGCLDLNKIITESKVYVCYSCDSSGLAD